MKIFWSVTVKVLTFALLAYCGIRVIFDCGYWAIPVGFLMVISFPLCTILHELGHMLFGAMVKIKAVPENVKQILLEWWGSSSCKIIPKTDKNLKSRIIFTTTGGLAVNFVFILLGVLALAVPAIPTGLCALLPASFHLFALNALPIMLDGGKTDGLVIYELAKNEDTAKVMLAVLAVQAQMLNGQPVDEKLLFEVPQIQEDDPSFISLTELRYEYFKAKGDEQEAEKYALRLEELKKEYM
ncbi:MAG: hypothetical protein HDP34_05970 [Clostridia bacterium]|nr:hypothetical protein [Clostridia bacterium]